MLLVEMQYLIVVDIEFMSLHLQERLQLPDQRHLVLNTMLLLAAAVLRAVAAEQEVCDQEISPLQYRGIQSP
jgi:hypothetical protein